MTEQEPMTVRKGKRANHSIFRGKTVICALVIAATVQSSVLVGGSTSAVAATTTVNNERVLIAIEGMHCTSCANGIKAMLMRTPGVISAQVSFEQREADVQYDPSRASPEKIIEAITNMGYKATVKAQGGS